MDGSIFLGPNAVLALKQEGYRFLLLLSNTSLLTVIKYVIFCILSWSDISISNTIRLLKLDGVQKLITKHIKFGINETLKSLYPAKQLKEIQDYIPDIKRNDIQK